MSLRHRLMALYVLMALTPTLIGTTVMLLYLRHKVQQATNAFHQEVDATLRHYQQRVGDSTQKLLTQVFTEVNRQTQQGLEHYSHKMVAQQERALEGALQSLNRRVSQASGDLQRATRQMFQSTLDEQARQVEAMQARALGELAQVATQASRDAIRTQAEQSSLSLTASLGRQVDDLLRNVIAQLTLVAQQPALRELRLQESRWILQALMDREPSYRLLCLRDASGQKLLTVSDLTLSEGSLQPLVATLWQQMEAGEGATVGEVLRIRGDEGEELVIPVLAPVRERGVELKGAVFALVALDELNRLIRAFRIGKQGYAMLCTAQGQILAHPDRRQIGQQEPQLVPLIAESMGQTRPQLRETNDALITLAPISTLQACIVVVQPTEEAFQLANTLQQQFDEARLRQQHELQAAFRQIQAQAGAEVDRQMHTHQRSLQQMMLQAQGQTAQETRQLLLAQSRASRTRLAQLLNSHLSQSQQQLEAQLRRLSSLSDLSQQFQNFAYTLQAQMNDQMINALLIVLLGVLMLSLFGSVYLYRTLNVPLKALMEATHALAQGDLGRRVQLPGRGAPELQQLAESFNRMVDALAKAEAQLIQSSKLASLGTLASGVAHELNQPLAIIRGIAQQTIQMLSDSQPSSGESAGGEANRYRALLEDMRLIERQTQRMSQIIMHLRTFARKPKAELELVNLNEVAQNALILLREQLKARDIELAEEYAPDLPPVKGEPNALEQVVINLLTNARDALEGQPDGQVVLRTYRVQEGGREWVVLSVQDNGPGVPAELRTQIFDPFFTTKDPGKGTGLGLAISLEIAQKHGGTVQLEEAATGAHFILRLPAAAQQREAA